MGWTGHRLKDGYILYTRGGLNGIFIGHKNNKGLEIRIPERLLIELAADAVRSEQISILEEMTDKQILGLEVRNEKPEAP